MRLTDHARTHPSHRRRRPTDPPIEQVVERPQYMLMRVALGIHGNDLAAALETYELMSNKWFLHASPTLFHAGTRFPQMSSCFLLTMREDSIAGIYDTLKQCAIISKAAGGIGLSVHNIRSHGSYIKGTKGTSNGLVPMLRVFDVTGACRGSIMVCSGERGEATDRPIRAWTNPCSPPYERWTTNSALRGPGRGQAPGGLCHLHRALARRRL